MANYDLENSTDTSEETVEKKELDVQEVPEEDVSSFSDETEEEYEDPILKKKKRKKIIRLSILGVIVLGIAAFVTFKIITSGADTKEMYTDVAVERRNISNTITGSSTVEPNDSYNVTTVKSGDITADYFKEGDTVKKGDKLYQFDDKDAQNSLSTAKNALTKAQQAYVDAVKQKNQSVASNSIATKNAQNSISKALNSLSDSQKTYSDQYVKSDINGKVKSLSISKGDSVNNGSPIATIYSDAYMKLRVPFNDYDAESISVGDSAEVSVTGSGDVIYGTVSEKASASTATNAHTMVVYVTIEVANPGALTENDKGSAVVNGVACADTANFEYIHTQQITAKVSGTVESLDIAEGDTVYSGTQFAYIKSDNVNTSLNNAQLAYDDALLALQKQVLNNDTFAQDTSIKNAQLALEDAKINLEKAQDAVDDYIVEAPIEGTVVTKNSKAGDTKEANNSNSEALCVIYDLSSVKISIDVDETEIALVKTGQTAKIKADAVDGEFKGEITKVPVDGKNENGVTTYTIEIKVEEYGDLLPGMNVDAEIVVEEANDVLSVPVNSVQRGDIVFVKDNGTQHENDVTDIINRKKQGAAGSNENADNTGNNKNEANNRNADADKNERPQKSDMPVISGATPEPKKKIDEASIPANIEIPEGYRAIYVETGINDTDYIEIKSGLNEDDMVRTLNTEMSSETASFDMEERMKQMQQQGMRSMQNGNMGGMSGGAPGGMGGGPGGR